jgi:hypothetical protein
MPLSNDARKVRGTIERSINVDSLQHHHELGRSVTDEGGVSLAPFLEKQWNRPLVPLGLRDFVFGDVALQHLRGVGKPGLRGLLHMR